MSIHVKEKNIRSIIVQLRIHILIYSLSFFYEKIKYV